MQKNILNMILSGFLKNQNYFTFYVIVRLVSVLAFMLEMAGQQKSIYFGRCLVSIHLLNITSRRSADQ